MSNTTRPTKYEIQNYREAYKHKYQIDFVGNDSIIRMAFEDAPHSTPDEENEWILEKMHEDTEAERSVNVQ